MVLLAELPSRRARPVLIRPGPGLDDEGVGMPPPLWRDLANAGVGMPVASLLWETDVAVRRGVGVVVVGLAPFSSI